jgi:hypothetical protein
MMLTDAELVAGFEASTLTEFSHREHVRVAFAMLRDADIAEAAVRFRRGLRAFVQKLGAEAKLHETLTWAYLFIVAERMHGSPAADSEAFLAANPDLLDHRNGALARYYDVASITRDPLARHVFVLPQVPR